MKRFLENYSAALSFLTVVVFGVSMAVLVMLDGRATWSGDPAPEAWVEAAKPDDIFTVPGQDVVYWGDPEARYSKYATRKRRKPVGVIVHHTSAKPVENLVKYGHVSDANRGGASFGYHFYIGRDGHIIQGAPLSRRTNHIKFSTNKQRRDTAKHLWSGNTIGVSLIGGCDPLMRPDWTAWQRCSDEFITKKQLRAGLAVVRALQDRFEMKCDEVFGHGDLQFDRRSFEGLRLSRLSRRVCELERAEEEDEEEGVDPPKPVEVSVGAKEAAAAKSKAAAGG